jgi:outer membrane receptor protein involved in Fe transport
MKKSNLMWQASSLALIMSGLIVVEASAQTETGAASEERLLNKVVVTASSGNATIFESSVSVTDVSASTIEDFTPRSEAEVFQLIPGIRVESTAGSGGNSNITVRGLPLAAGGAKYVQLQEDGLPVVEFGDIAFGNNDYWIRYDWTVDNVQAIRGGSASTYASQAPGAVINYISRTGEEAGGRIGVSTGLGYDEKRYDFNYGSPITDTLRFNVGGFYREGSGPRDIPYKALDGYQIKGNITQDIGDGRGFIRINFKRLDDRAPTYTASPFEVELSGNTITGYKALPGFDALTDTNFSVFNLTFPTITPQRTVKLGDNRDGISVEATTLGLQFEYDIDDRFSIDAKFKNTDQSGRFSAPFYGSVARVSDIIGTTVNGATVTDVRFANGPQAGQAAPGALPVNRNPNLYTDMNDMGHLAGDFGLTGKFELAEAGTLTVRAGYYTSRQNINMDWHWNESFNAGTANNPARLDLFDATGTALTDAGLSGYNNQWGACCARAYDLQYSGDAPYLSASWANGPLDLDASVRFDTVEGSGTFFGTQAGGPVDFDINGDGVISVAESNSFLAANINPQIINYETDYTSWSVGGNYQINSNTSVFARASKGSRANADRVVSDFAGAFTATGDLTALGNAVAVNPVEQREIGVKHRGSFSGVDFDVFLTGFMSDAEEYNFDLTTQQQTFQTYETFGFELESQANWGPISVLTNLIYTDSEIAEDQINGNAGKVPRAQPDWMWLVAPTYDFDALGFGDGAVGFAWRGQTKSFPQDNNLIAQEGYSIVNAFARIEPIEGVTVGINVNNIFDEWDQAGRLDQGSVADLQATGAVFGVPFAATNRVGLGRTVTASISYDF